MRHHQAYEYEASSAGESPLESWSAHQYLAVGQEAGADNFPQVFFTGLAGDMFDKMTTQAAATGDRWWCYTDLADYLDGRRISNLEIALPWPTAEEQQDGTRLVQWIPPEPIDLWAVRMDFTDPDPARRWRGRLTVKVDGPGGPRTSYRQRSGTTESDPFYGVRAPLALSARGDSKVSKLTIVLSREAGTNWPDITRLVADKYVVPVIANGVAGELSTSSYTVQPGTHPDSAPTHVDFRRGKLTDGLRSPTGDWNWPGAMGWNFYGGHFTITIDLGRPRKVSRIDLFAHYDQTAGIGWPDHPLAYIGLDTPARHAGIEGLTEKSMGTSREHTLAAHEVSGTPQQAGTVSLAVPDIDGRYVTVHAHGAGWILLDEVQVKDETGAVVSEGQPYTVNPVPSVEQGQQTPYGDNADRLTNQIVTPVFAPQFNNLVDGVPSGTGGYVQVAWVGPRPVRTATLWFTRPSQADGVTLPPMPIIGCWRDQNGEWHEESNVVFIEDGAAPHASMVLPFDAQVTGVRMDLDPTPGTNGWYMVSEFTAR
ncbi:hypothetical protein [Streptomyces melanogenes]|uniref:hypothetical protein n=1 Tax=Streptomyces melanogenes TaxID=67326 RepID=UPI00167DD444|nr:hypothetical protein [Streptomyces melanogenes]